MIRRLTLQDAEAFSRVRLLGLELHPEAFGTSADAWRTASPERVHAVLEPGEDAHDHFVLGAFAEESLVGLLGFRREKRASVRHKGSLWGLFVHPDHRRRGWGGHLLRAMFEELRGLEGLCYLRLVATTANWEAIHLFESHGFARYGLETGGIRANGTPFDQAFLRRDVDARP